MRSIITIALCLIASPVWAYCSIHTRDYGTFRSCLDNEQEAKQALDAYREETNNRLERLEQEQRDQEMREMQAREEQQFREEERELRDLERQRHEALR